MADGLVEMVPFADVLDGLFFNPAYSVGLRGETGLRLQKQRALLESRFCLERGGDFPEEDESLLLASVVTMLLEREHC